MEKIEDTKNWLYLEDSITREGQTRFYIATTVEEYLNGCRDDNYPAMTAMEWFKYVWELGNQTAFIKEYGKHNILKLLSEYLTEYKPVKNYVVELIK